ncbi:MAG: hypothetical protein COB22_03950 [Cycloclasticus sp.]|nr:MAG: hypothetical protein COB22_03950 [Cycloclasticus sp.]
MITFSADTKPLAVISIIIDDMGYRLKEGVEAINLPAALTYALLPNAPHTEHLSKLARQQGKEIMLHMPMQATLDESPEQGVLALDMSEKQVVETMKKAFAKVPDAVGMNNHRGSLLTRHPGHMTWVMSEINKKGIFFVDSRTSKKTVAEKVAKEFHVPVLRRDVFLDHEMDIASIERQLQKLIQIAKKQGRAIAIGHPHSVTLSVLNDALPRLKALNIEVVPVSEQIQDFGRVSMLATTVVADKRH